MDANWEENQAHHNFALLAKTEADLLVQSDPEQLDGVSSRRLQHEHKSLTGILGLFQEFWYNQNNTIWQKSLAAKFLPCSFSQ